jgi:hypothetical protein
VEATALQFAAGPCELQVVPEFVEVKIGLELATATNLTPSAEEARLVQAREGSGPLGAVTTGIQVAPELVET